MSGPVVLDGRPGDRVLLDRIVLHLDDGGLLAYPTETVYGLGAAGDEEGVRSLVALKARSSGKPFLVLLPGPSGNGTDMRANLRRWGLECPTEARVLAESLWPGPLTLVLSDPEGRFPLGVRGPDGGVAVRVSSHPFVYALLDRWKRPLLSTSANRPDQPPAGSALEVAEHVAGRLGVDRLWIVDGGTLPESLPSTLVDCTGARVRVVREGVVPLNRIRELVPGVELDVE
ncbi:MAG: Sua5/YciO/YrdC/YwlC family protein [Gemmatimonadetes bacterium]|nr:Sua5/YciO/YrdC/YwlC family protein [Gemmatimonadota bacterium]